MEARVHSSHAILNVNALVLFDFALDVQGLLANPERPSMHHVRRSRSNHQQTTHCFHSTPMNNMEEIPPTLVFKEESITRLNGLALTLLFEGREDHALEVMNLATSHTVAKLCDLAANFESPNRRIEATVAPFELTGVVESSTSNFALHNVFLFYRYIFSIDAKADETRAAESEEEEDDPLVNIVPDRLDELERILQTKLLTETEVAYGQDLMTTPMQGAMWDYLSLYVLQLYNMAVIHHEVGYTRGDFRALRRAHCSYRTALSILLLQQENASRHVSTPAMTVLLLALYNNLGHTAETLQDYETMEACHVGMEDIIHNSNADKNTAHGYKALLDFFRTSSRRATEIQEQRHAPAA